VTVRFGEPVVFGPECGVASSARVRREVTDRVMAAISESSTQERVGRYNDPDQEEGRPAQRG
jgi:1-acyl-sn-glycerol-3-phosphate acyltransferase